MLIWVSELILFQMMIGKKEGQLSFQAGKIGKHPLLEGVSCWARWLRVEEAGKSGEMGSWMVSWFGAWTDWLKLSLGYLPSVVDRASVAQPGGSGGHWGIIEIIIFY